MICKQCINKATKTTKGKGQFLLWGCREKRIEFGNTTDYRAGKNMPVKCDKLNKGAKHD